MPELPEVETVMRGLRHRLAGRRIVAVMLRRPDLRRALPERMAERVTGAVVAGFRRRAKYILMRLSTGESLLIHLGMSGRVLLAEAGAEPAAVAHEHVVMRTDDGGRMGFVDPRRFGSIDLVATDAEDAHPLLAGLGPEPLGDAFTAPVLRAALAGRRTSIKAALLDQRIVAGLGNIYVCEALYRAGISPLRLAGAVGARRVGRLVSAIRETLEEAVAAGGSSLRDYVQPNGELGYFQNNWKVYGREGMRCETCPGPPACHGISRFPQGGRSSFVCPLRQR